MGKAGFFAQRGSSTSQSIAGPLLSALNHIRYWRRIPKPASVTPSSTFSITTVSGAGGSCPNISRAKMPSISRRRRAQSAGDATFVPSANVRGSSSV